MRVSWCVSFVSQFLRACGPVNIRVTIPIQTRTFLEYVPKPRDIDMPPCQYMKSDYKCEFNQ